MILASLSLAWVAGVFLGSTLDLPWPIALAWLVPLAPTPLLPSRARKNVVLAALLMAAATAGFLRFSMATPHPGQVSIAELNGSEATVRGRIDQEPEVRRGTMYFRLSGLSTPVGGSWADVAGRVLVRARPYPEYRYGDVLELRGALEDPALTNSQAYATRLAQQGIVSQLQYPRVEVLQGRHVPWQLELLQRVRGWLSRAISASLPQPEASLGQALLLGDRSGIPSSLNDAFARAGVTHLLAVSGMNLSILAGMLLAVAVFLMGRRRFLYVWAAMLGVWLYAALTGMEPPVFRAAIMATVFLLAEYFGRQASAFTAIAFAAAVMTAFDPAVLWSVSFQLSFAAMSGITLLSPLFISWASRIVAPFATRMRVPGGLYAAVAQAAAVTLGATVATWPLVAHYFGTISLLSLPATLVLAPLMPLAMVTTAAAAVAIAAFPGLAWAVNWTGWLPLKAMVEGASLFASPGAALLPVSAPAWAVIAFYGALVTTITLRPVRRWGAGAGWGGALSAAPGAGGGKGSSLDRATRLAVLPLVMACILVWAEVLNGAGGRLAVSFLDVGNGDAILVRTPGGRDVLIDGGPDGQALEVELGRQMPFWDRTLDAVVLTHAHADHLTGLLKVLEDYRVGMVVESGVGAATATYGEWRQSIERRGIKRELVSAGRVLDLGNEVRIEVLNPQGDAAGGQADPDQSGLVLRVTYGDASFLLAADIGRDTELMLAGQRAVLSSDVLKVAHHGSSGSTSGEFLAIVRPSAAIVSVAGTNQFGMPDPAVLARLWRYSGERVYLTSDHGTVDAWSDGKRIWIRTSR